MNRHEGRDESRRYRRNCRDRFGLSCLELAREVAKRMFDSAQVALGREGSLRFRAPTQTCVRP